MNDCVAAQAGLAPTLSPRPFPPRRARKGANCRMWPVVLPSDSGAPSVVDGLVMVGDQTDWLVAGGQSQTDRTVAGSEVNSTLTPIVPIVCEVPA